MDTAQLVLEAPPWAASDAGDLVLVLGRVAKGLSPLFSQRRWLFSGVVAWREAFAWARLHGVVNGVVWTHGVIALFSAIGSGLGGLRFLGRDAQAAAFRSMA